jgi:hypothetical protein
VRARRRSYLALAAVTAALAAVQLATGVDELTLYAAPLLLLCALLLSGTFVGEDWIAARRRRSAAPVPCRAAARRWTRERERALTSLLERGVRTLRGPPAVAAARPS